jgi:signal transduction histidine kinase
LNALIAVEVVTACSVLLLAMYVFREFDKNATFLRRFTVAPVVAIEEALDEAIQLRKLVTAAPRVGPIRNNAETSLRTLQKFYHRYRGEWEVVGGTSDEAARVRERITRIRRRELLEEERAALVELNHSLSSFATVLAAAPPDSPTDELARLAAAIQRSLHDVLGINISQVEVAHGGIQERQRRYILAIAILAGCGIAGATLLGLLVRRAIQPRTRRLISVVRQFQEEGVYEPIEDPGNDDLAVLAHALDAGFASIVAHERARERFLSIVAHELKTPVSSIRGFVEVAQMLPPTDSKKERALQIINRNARRLSHMIEDVLLAARARTRDLPFRPRPIDLVPLTRRVVTEVQVAVVSHRFEMTLPERVCILADEKLLGHALWSLATSAAYVSVERAPVEITIFEHPARPRLEIRLPQPAYPPEELEAALTPFGSLAYEDRGLHSSVGFFLCREIARLHGGTLRVESEVSGAATLTLELPV